MNLKRKKMVGSVLVSVHGQADLMPLGFWWDTRGQCFGERRQSRTSFLGSKREKGEGIRVPFSFKNTLE